MKSAKDLAIKLKDARAEIKQLRAMLERRDNLISDLMAREQACISSLAGLSQGLGIDPPWNKSGSWDSAMKNKAASDLERIAKMQKRSL